MSWVSSVINVKVLQLVPLGCFIDTSFHRSLVAETVVPVLISVIIVLLTLVRSRLARTNADAAQIRKDGFSMFLALTYLIFSSVSTRIFLTFRCEAYGDDPTNYLVADLSIDCDGEEHVKYKSYAWVMMIVYPFGITALYSALLVSNRSKLASGEAEHLAFLTEMYTKKAWWFEIAECVRRLSMTGLLVFVSPGTSAQIVTALLLCIVGIEMYSLFEPFATLEDQALAKVSSWAIFATLFGALLVKLEAFEEKGAGKDVLGVVLIFMNVVGFLAVLVNVILEIAGSAFYVARFFHKHDGSLTALVDSASAEEFKRYCKDVAMSTKEEAGWEPVKGKWTGVVEERASSGNGYIDQVRWTTEIDGLEHGKMLKFLADISGASAGLQEGGKVVIANMVLIDQISEGAKILLREVHLPSPYGTRDFMIEQYQLEEQEKGEEGGKLLKMFCSRSHSGSGGVAIADIIGDRRDFVRGFLSMETFALRRGGSSGKYELVYIYSADYNSSYVPKDVLFRRVSKAKIKDIELKLAEARKPRVVAVVDSSSSPSKRRNNKIVPVICDDGGKEDEKRGALAVMDGGVEEIVENELRIRAGGGDEKKLGSGEGGEELEAELKAELTAKAKDEGRREGEGGCVVADELRELVALFDADEDGLINKEEVEEARRLIESIRLVKNKRRWSKTRISSTMVSLKS